MGLESIKKIPLKWLILVVAGIVILVTIIFFVVLSNSSERVGERPVSVVESIDEPDIPLPTEYIVLTYPAALEEDVTVSSENLTDGQLITFTTDFTDEELVLFQFSISVSGDDGFALGVLEDDEAGDLIVSMHVPEYTSGNWNPEDFNKLNAMQERVNDIIIQFYDDPRFVPNH